MATSSGVRRSTFKNIEQFQDVIIQGKKSSEIGKGGFGKVRSMCLIGNKEQLYAIKSVNVDEIVAKADDAKQAAKLRQSIFDEAVLLASFDHDNIVKVFGSFSQKAGQSETFFIVMELCHGGTLKDLIRRQKELFSYDQVIAWAAQIVAAIEYLHVTLHVMHRDIKSDNIFVDPTKTLLKIGDFGIAKKLESTQAVVSTGIGTFTHMSPEVLKGEPYGLAADIWAFGVVLYEICALRLPFVGNPGQVALSVVQGNVPEIPSNCPLRLRRFISDDLLVDISKRISIRDICQSDIFVSKQSLSRQVERSGHNDVSVGANVSHVSYPKLKMVPINCLIVDVGHLSSDSYPTQSPTPIEFLFKRDVIDNPNLQVTPHKLIAAPGQGINLYRQDALNSFVEGWPWQNVDFITASGASHRNINNVIALKVATELHLFNVEPLYRAAYVVQQLNAMLKEDRGSAPQLPLPRMINNNNNLPSQSVKSNASKMSDYAPTTESNRRIKSIFPAKIRVDVQAETDTFNKCLDDVEYFADQRLPQYRKALDEFMTLQAKIDKLKAVLADKKAKKKDKKAAEAEIKAAQERLNQLKPFIDQVYPSPEAFTQIFEKVRLTVMLMTRLRPYLARSLPPETPLEVLATGLFSRFFAILNFANAMHAPPMQLVNDVQQPIFTRGDVSFMERNILDKGPEISQIYQSLGPSWKTPIEEWNAQIPAYKPVFQSRDGPQAVALRFLDPPTIAKWLQKVRERERQIEEALRRMEPANQHKFKTSLVSERKRHGKVVDISSIVRYRHLLVEIDEILEIRGGAGDEYVVCNVNGESGNIPKVALEGTASSIRGQYSSAVEHQSDDSDCDFM